MKSKILIVLPAFNAAKTLRGTLSRLPADFEAEILLVDDKSSDNTLEIVTELGLQHIKHTRNIGYGANQKTCYNKAKEKNIDIVVMLHPDNQYDPRMIEGLVLPIKLGICDMVMGNRIRSRSETLKGGMPFIKYLANRILTITENLILGQNLGEFHSGYRAYSIEMLKTLNFNSFSDDFSFDSEFLIAAVFHKFKIGDVPVPTIYEKHSSQISFSHSIIYALKTVKILIQYLIQKTHLIKFEIFEKSIFK